MDVVDTFKRYRLKRGVNAAGTMTSIGSSIVTPDAIAAPAALQPHFVSMSELQARASEAIAKSTGAEAGYVTACAASGITLCFRHYDRTRSRLRREIAQHKRPNKRDRHSGR